MKRLMIVLMMVIVGCSEYNSDIIVVCSTSIHNAEDNCTWTEREIDEPTTCREGEVHYIDPYTKVEYCLPEDLTSIRNINAYRIEKEK